jgi:hypothetical protein
MTQLRIVRFYGTESDKTGSDDLPSVAASLPALTVDRAFMPMEKNDTGTPFKEVYNVPVEDAVLQVDFPSDRKTPLDFGKLAEAIEMSIMEAWDPNQFNFVFHSNGFDSRVMSHFVRRAYLANPGKILFVCFPPEHERFLEIMKFEGWEPDQYMIYDIEKQEGIWDFDTLWKKINGCSNIPWNKTRAALGYLQEKKIVPESILKWGAVYGNETLGWKKDFKSFINNYYYSRYSRLTLGFHVPNVQHMLNLRTLKVIFESEPVQIHDKARFELLKFVNPKLAAIPRDNFSVIYSVPKKEFKDLETKYRKSYYYRTFAPKSTPTPLIWNQGEWWRDVTLASFIEHLISLGVKIS